jgi:PAS domain S-box-containing protein
MTASGTRGNPADEKMPLLDDDAEELYEDAPCGYLSTAPDGTIRRVNRTFLAWSGYHVNDLVGQRRLYDLLPPGAKIYYETHYAPLLQMQGSVREIALELVCADGRRLPVLVNAVMKYDPSGEPLVVRVTVFDATERRQYERALLEARGEAEARAAAATALQHVTEGVVLVDEDGRIRLLNPAAEAIFGVVEDEVRGLPLATVSADWPSIAGRIPVVGGVDPPSAAIVVPLELAGTTRWLAVTGKLAPVGTVYTLRDVTEQRELDEFRDDIITVVSHELRTPLAGVYGAAQTLVSLGDRIGDGERRQLVGVIGEQSGRLVRIVEEILLTQRLDANDVTPARRVFDVGSAVERVVASTQIWRAARKVVVATVADVEAEGDPVLFEQVLVNLVDNAVRYSPAATDVQVTVSRFRAHVRVTVADSGPGIAPSDRERIFEKFFRVDPEQATGTSGTGLGLYIARELAQRMHGSVGLLQADAGATFYVDVPAASAGSAPAAG